MRGTKSRLEELANTCCTRDGKTLGNLMKSMKAGFGSRSYDPGGIALLRPHTIRMSNNFGAKLPILVSTRSFASDTQSLGLGWLRLEWYHVETTSLRLAA